MADAVSVSLGIIQILVQLVALYLAFKLTRITGGFLAWWLIISALVLMTLRRITALMIELGEIPAFAGLLSFIDRILLPFLISILLVLAMYDLVKRFQAQSRKT